MTDQPNESEVKLQNLIEKSHQILFTAKAIFPFQLFPDQITIDLSKVTIEYRHLLRTEDIRTILLQDIYQVEVIYTLFMATLVINQVGGCKVPFLRKADAVRAKQIITGFQIAQREMINLGEVGSKDLADKLAEIGRAHHPTQ